MLATEVVYIVWHACKPNLLCICTYDGIKVGSALAMQALMQAM